MLLAACTAHPPHPVEIDPADVCAFCKMAISSKRYAAEMIDAGGNVFKFDDIGCMIHFAQQRGWIERPTARFVHEYDSPVWLEAGRATFVRSSEIRSPMASGLIAVQDPAKAKQYAARFHGNVYSLAELWK
jgi:copper chaperone NosL